MTEKTKLKLIVVFCLFIIVASLAFSRWLADYSAQQQVERDRKTAQRLERLVRECDIIWPTRGEFHAKCIECVEGRVRGDI